MTVNETFSERLSKARAIRGLSQLEVGQALGKDSAVISKWERGRNKPRPKHLRDVAGFLRVNLRWLTFGEGPMELSAKTDSEG